MLRKPLRFSVAVALGILFCAIIYQRERIGRLEAMLQERTQQRTVLRDQRDDAAISAEKDNSRLNPSGSATADQSRELLRLRGEVSVLKRQLAEVVDHASKDQAQQQLAPNQTGIWTEADLNRASS